MKNKPTRHKETNAFKFEPFSQRIANLDIDVFHRIGHTNEELDEDETFFNQTLQKWNVLNLSESYEQFRNELPSVPTLPLLLNQSDVVIEVILKHLSKNNPLSLQPILDLLAALMKDLRHEIYPAYGDVLKNLCGLLSTKDADALEWVLTCLAYMFKYLWRYIVKDLETVFNSLIPLFSASKPSYINNFAAESFAYVARKVKNKKEFVRLVLKSVERRLDCVEGCGRLMFEVLKGVQHRFHSSAQEFILILFEMLYDSSVDLELYYEMLKETCHAMCVSIERKFMYPFWIESFHVLSQFYEDSNVLTSVLYNLQLIKQVLDFKCGVLLVDPSATVCEILKLLDKVRSEKVSLVMASIVATLLQCPNVQLSQENSCELTLKVLKLPFESTVLKFVIQVLSYTGFETFVLPWIQTFASKIIYKNSLESGQNHEMFNFFARIILFKAPPSLNGINLDNWKRYPLDFIVMCENNWDKEESEMELLFHESALLQSVKDKDVEYLISLCIVLPHINLTYKTRVVSKLNKLMSLICSQIIKYSTNIPADNSSFKKLLFLFLLVLEALIHTAKFVCLKETCSLQFMVNSILPFVSNPQFVSALSALDLYLTSMIREKESNFYDNSVKQIVYLLLENLSSPYHKIRLLSIHSLFLLSTFDDQLSNNRSYFEYCFQSECVSVTVLNYREKLMHLQKLSYELIDAKAKYKEALLQYLLGVFYVNFQLLWEPVMELINSYAKEMPVTDFWRVFGMQLKKASNDVIVKSNLLKCDSLKSEFLSLMYNDFHDFDDNPDFFNYRLLLWKCFAKFSEVCEAKSREVSPLFFNFLENEYFIVNSDDYYRNVKQHISRNTEIIEGKSSDVNKISEKHLNCGQMYKALVAFMSVFAKVRNPKVIYGESQLRQHYYDFLTCKNPNVQKLALDCIMTYKEKYLVPYSSHIYGLLNDKTFKSELVMFQISKDTSVVEEQHRPNLIPVVMRILYGRMLTKTSRSGPRKTTPDCRRSLILRFLSGCQENEILSFLELSFKIYLPYLQGNPLIMVKKLDESIDLNCVISLKRLRSSLNMLLTVLENLGGLMGIDVQSFVFNVLLCIGGYTSSMLSKKTEIFSGYSSGLRILRNSSLTALTKFFSQFPCYPWNSQEVDALFTVFIYPSLDKLHIEGIHSPTALLKLFAAWSRELKYFSFLVKPKDDSTITPLSCIMKLLNVPKVRQNVTSMILQIIESLLTTADIPEGESSDQSAEVKKMDGDFNYGCKILLPFVPVIIQHLQNKLSIRRKKGLSPRDLMVLSRVCELTVDGTTSENLLNLLFHTFIKKVDGPESTITHLVSTLCSLLKNVSSPFDHIRSIAPLFGTVSSIDARKMLCRLLVEVLHKQTKFEEETLLENVKLVQDINAWDSKWVEQPDFGCRLDGFKRVHQMVEKEKIILDIGLIIVHNCFYQIKYENDLSLRDSSGYCLRKLSPFLCIMSKTTKDLSVPDSMLKLIASSIRQKSNETVQQEAISLLGELVRVCPDVHPILQDMKDLVCKEDPEVDFFNNIIHLQSHRRGRALMRFCSVAKSMVRRPRTHTLTQFILPLISSFLCEDKYAQKKSIIDASIITLGTVCKFLPWYHYETVLRFYLSKLRTLPAFQKQLVRVIVSILDGFHFDFCNLKKTDFEEDAKYNSKEKKSVKMPLSISASVDSFREATELKSKKAFLNDISNKPEGVQDPAGIVPENNQIVEEKDNSIEEEEELSENEHLECETDEEGATDDLEKAETTKEETLLTINLPAILLPLKLSSQVSDHVINSLTKGLLPHLLKAIGECKSTELVHKVNRKNTAAEQEEEDTMRIPVALAIVKLLQKLPSKYLDLHLPNIFLNICKFLKSRLESVRRVAREMLQKIMESLGPAYLSTLLGEMTALLTKGFQIHVLIFTMHSVLSSMKATLKAGDLDSSLTYILDICKLDLFGMASEEKEVAKIAGRVLEARSHKSFDSLRIAAQFITEKCLIDLLLPLKNVLASTSSYTILMRVSECLRNIVNGLSDNLFVPVESLLILIYGVISGNITAFKMKNETIKDREENPSPLPCRSDSFIIPEPPRTRFGAITAKPSISSDRNTHLLVEFGFSLLHILLKRGKGDPEVLKTYVDPIVLYLLDNVSAKHVKLTTITLRCLLNCLNMDLPNIKKNINVLCTSLFSLLHKYATTYQAQGEYLDMVLATFKTLTVVIRDVKYHVINETQLKTLLLYVEQNLQDSTKQATAFPLLKAILMRKLDSPEIGSVMEQVSQLSIVSEYDHVRDQSRHVFFYYLMNYPLGNKVDDYINFYLSHLNYELEPGRLSVLKMLFRIILKFPMNAVQKYGGLCFVTLGAALENDDRVSCKKLCYKCLKQLLMRVESEREKLFGITVTWLGEMKIAHQRLGAQVCGIFVEVEKEKFTKYLPVILPKVHSLLNNESLENRPGKYVRVETIQNDLSDEAQKRKSKQHDYCTFQVLQLIKKICAFCPAFLKDDKWMCDVEIIGDTCQYLLEHPHEWVRLEACGILGYIFGSINIQSLVETVSSSSNIEGKFLFNNTGPKIRSLVLDLCAQLQPNYTGSQLVEQVAKNLAFLGRLLLAFPDNVEIFAQDSKVSLMWMIRRMKKIVNLEIVLTPSTFLLRESVFKWIGAMVVELPKTKLRDAMTQILTPLARELLDEEESNPDLLRLARGIVRIIKKKLGVAEYTEHLSKVQVLLATKRAVRKRDRKQEAISNPEIAAKRKIRKQQKKKISKKRKMDEYKGRVAPKRKFEAHSIGELEKSGL